MLLSLDTCWKLQAMCVAGSTFMAHVVLTEAPRQGLSKLLRVSSFPWASCRLDFGDLPSTDKYGHLLKDHH